MKKILGLDLGTTSIGWALVNEKENDNEQSSIIKLGVRVNPLSVDEQSNFEKGKAITTNADRTKKRSARRNLQRFKLRRENLLTLLKEHGFITDETAKTFLQKKEFNFFQMKKIVKEQPESSQRRPASISGQSTHRHADSFFETSFPY